MRILTCYERPSERLALVAAAILLLVIPAACGEATPSPPVYVPQQAPSPVYSPAPSPEPSLMTAIAPSGTPSPTLSTPPSATPIYLAPSETPTVRKPTPSPEPAPPLPTPHPDNSAWVKKRLDAVVALYRPTSAGAALLRSLDMRQMKGEPGFFGSYGFDSWAGVGEAKQVGVMHELMHSYWGGFPVIGRPDLGWERQEGKNIAPALASYHRDILAFMAQPPDDYEMLRQRLRNLPGLSGDNTEPLFHSLETDLPYTTGGDLGLVPPILHKYWGYFLTAGPFYNWERAAGWFQSLSHEQRTVADKFLGFQHLDLRQYANDITYATPTSPLSAADQILAEEERQRLTDLAEQFDLLLGDAQLEENFQFWRSYLQDKVTLYRIHPGHLDSVSLPRASELAGALEFLSRLEGSPESRASMLADRIYVQPFLVNFLPAVDNGTLVKLFADAPVLPGGPTLQATASFVERLQRFGDLTDRVLAEGRESPEMGARAVEQFLAETGFDQEQDLRLFFNLFHDADPPVAHRTMAAVDKATVRNLMIPVPVQLRTLLRPERLLEKLDITAEATEADLRRGITLLITEASGNYRIDEPFLERLYAVMAARAKTSLWEVARVMAETPFPLEGMIMNQPAAASAALSGDLGLAVVVVENSDGVAAPPARIIYRLIMADPDLAATLVIALEHRGQTKMVSESLSYFAYDKARLERFPQLLISLSQDGAFLHSLLERQGEGWLQRRLAEAVALYRERAAAGQVAPDFLQQYRETLQAAADTLDLEAGGQLTQVIRTAFD